METLAGDGLVLPAVKRTRELVPEERRFSTETASIEEPGDYVTLVNELAGITGGALKLDGLRCSRAGKGYKLVGKAAGKAISATLERQSGWVDMERLTGFLDRALRASKSPRRLFPDNGEGDVGLLFATPEEIKEVRRLDHFRIVD